MLCRHGEVPRVNGFPSGPSMGSSCSYTTLQTLRRLQRARQTGKHYGGKHFEARSVMLSPPPSVVKVIAGCWALLSLHTSIFNHTPSARAHPAFYLAARGRNTAAGWEKYLASPKPRQSRSGNLQSESRRSCGMSSQATSRALLLQVKKGAGWFIRGDSGVEWQLQQIYHKVRLDQAVKGGLDVSVDTEN